MSTPVYPLMRVGHGKELQFFAADFELESYLRGLGQARLLVSDGGDKSPCLLVNSLSGELERGRWQFWLVPDGLEVPAPPLDAVTCSLHGCVLLQHGMMRKGGQREASRIAVVDKVRKSDTGAIIKNELGVRLFNQLARMIKKDLTHTTIQVFRDGHEEEDARLQLMTRGAVEAWRNGFAFTRKPGKALRGG
jgi:hypothetical protein